MKESYLFKKTDSAKPTANLDTTSYSIIAKNKKNYFLSLISSLSLLLLFFLGNNMNAQSTAVFTSSSTWTCPAGVTSITVEAWGAGAGGRTGGATKGYTGAGGGGGAYARLNAVSVTPGNTYTLTVGGVSGFDTAGNESTATFGSNTIRAAGGSIGAAPDTNATGGTGGTVATSIGDVRFAGGNGGNSYGFTTSSGGGSGGGGGGGGGGTGIGNNGLTPTLYSTGGNGGALVNNFGGAGGKGGNDGGPGANASTTGYGGGGGGAGDKGGGAYAYIGGSGQHGAIIITLLLANGPGGVTQNLQLWLRSDLLDGTITVADNSPVTTWQTQALGANAIKPVATGAPIYKNNAAANINFNSVVDFTNDGSTAAGNYLDNDPTRKYLKGSSAFYSQDMFVVMVPNNSTTSASARMDIFCGDRSPTVQETDLTGIGFGNYTVRFNNEVLTYALGTSTGLGNGYGVAHISTSASYNSPGIINTRNNSDTNGQELFFNGNNVVNNSPPLSGFANVSNSQYWIGRSEGIDGSLNAKVAEVITYNSRTTDAQRSNIRSYLAIKYGITLGVNGTSMNYTNSAGTTIWDATATGYNFDIAGIGRDDLSKLNQKQSRSSNLSTDVTIGLGQVANTNTANTNSFTSNRDYLVWGCNNLTFESSGTTTNVNLGGISTSFIAGNRKYKIVETGIDTGEVVVSLPKTTLTSSFAKTATQEYVLIVSSTAAFAAADIIDIIPMTDTGTNLETWYDFDTTKFFSFGIANQVENKYRVDNQAGDFIVGERNINLGTSFTVSGWIRTISAGTFVSKTNAYQFYVDASNKVAASWNGSNKIVSNTPVNDGKWHYVAITYSGGTANLYIDGVLDNTVNSLPDPISNTSNFSIGAVYTNKSAITNLFNGDIDEIRIWTTPLSITQIRYIMNQEIEKSGSISTSGKIIPNTIPKNEVSSVLWSTLQAYYDLNTYYGTAIKDKSDSNRWARIKYLTTDKITVATQTAPLPYQSIANGDWTTSGTWDNGSTQNLPYSMSLVTPSIPIDWNIVKTSHTISSTGNKTVLGLLVDAGIASIISATNNSKIEVSHYLKLDGKIDLVGRSQLVQTEGSDLAPTSAGWIERDQQGQSKIYNYNYWSPPVNPINNSANNTNYTVKGILKDGTTATPEEIKWIGGYDGLATPLPISLASYWLYTFNNGAVYADWVKINESTFLQVGKGFTLKGSGAGSPQNLTFVGKPNNGTITTTVGPDQLSLTGNPYPSAIDANAFITNNNSSIDGTIYFWEHFASNSSHYLASYQGGYAERNLTGGVAALAYGGLISSSGTQSKGSPNKFIPVGQGFFVNGSATGGTVTFRNSLRGFETEENILNTSNILYKTTTKKPNHWNDNSIDPVEQDTYKRVRLGYNSANGYHRQVLLGFMEENATSGIDYGYDGLMMDDFPNDMYLLNSENQLVIQGEGFFDENASYPIGVKTDSIGKVSFTIDELENFDDNQKVFIYDKSDDTYHNIKDTFYEVELPAGTIEDRFYLRFTDKTLGTNTFSLSKSDEAIVIVNQNVTVQSSNQLIKNIAVYDLLGRKIDSYKKVNASKYTLSHLNKTTSGLIVKITLENDTVVSKKIIY
ncbi:LamG-like jellyroll fold domain-containing protein [Flavobacterium sp. LS2P90]|uniref:LamG-like jellyroll fold domain-containing protein n=1 Tax=Flavobacterium xylosi TaxID=3230415 RepID=A0ABW6HYR5_9FLAO